MNFITIFWESGNTLSQRLVRSALWIVIFQITNQSFRLIRTIILARFLVPSDFGLVGIATITISFVEIFSQTGFRQALVQSEENIEDYLDTAWTISVIRGFLLFAILFYVAPFLSQFFKNPRATLVIQAMAISLMFRGLSSIGIIYFAKELEFRKNVFLQLGNTTVSLAVSILLAFTLKNVWAIVLGSLSGSLIEAVLSYRIHPYRPKVRFNLSRAKELFTFGKYILASGILVFLVTQGDKAIVGKILGTTALGFYMLAYEISNIPATQITPLISRLTFPTYSKLKKNIFRLRDSYFKILKLTTFISIPLSGGIFTLAPDFIRIFLGEKWMPIVPPMQILVLAGLLRSLAATMSPLFLAIGKPEIDTKLQILRLFVLGSLFYPFASKWGILGASVAVLLSIFFTNIAFIFMTSIILRFNISIFIKIVIFPLINTIIMILLLSLFRNTLQTITLFEFLFLIGIGTVVLSVFAYLSDKYFDYGVGPLIKQIRYSIMSN